MGYLERMMQDKDEQVVQVTRQHWTVLVKDTLIFAFIVVLILVIGISLALITGQAIIGLIAVLLALIPAIILAVNYAQWYAKQYVLTTERVIEIEGIFSKSAKDSSLEKINDVIVEQSFLGRVLGYGNLQVLTGNELDNKFERIAHPLEFKVTMGRQKRILDEHHSRGTPIYPALDHIPDQAPDLPPNLPSQAQSPAAAGAYPDSGTGRDDIPAQISRLAQLRDQGILTEEEFQAKKADLLRRL